MRAFLLALLLAPLSADAARVADEPGAPPGVPPTPTDVRAILPSGEGCRGATDLTNTFASLRPAVSACLAARPSDALLVLDITAAGAVSVHIGDPTTDACLAGATAPSLGDGPCTLRFAWPRWADPRTLPEPPAPKDPITEDARIDAAKRAFDAAGLAPKCAPALGGAVGTWKLALGTAEDGRVTSVAVTPQAKPNAAFEACLLDAAWAVRFPAMRPALPVKKTFRFE